MIYKVRETGTQFGFKVGLELPEEQQQQNNAHQPTFSNQNQLKKKEKATDFWWPQTHISQLNSTELAGFVHFGHWYRKILGCFRVGGSRFRIAEYRWESLLTGGEDLNWGASWSVGGGDQVTMGWALFL